MHARSVLVCSPHCLRVDMLALIGDTGRIDKGRSISIRPRACFASVIHASIMRPASALWLTVCSTLLGASSAAHTFGRHLRQRPRARRVVAPDAAVGFVSAPVQGRVSLRRVDPVRHTAALVVQPQLRKRTFGRQPEPDCEDPPGRDRGGRTQGGLGALGSAVEDAWSAIAAHAGVNVVYTTRTATTFVYASTPAARPTPAYSADDPASLSARPATPTALPPSSRPTVSVGSIPNGAAIDGTPLEIAQADGIIQQAGAASGAGTTSFGVWALDDSAIAFGYFIDVRAQAVRDTDHAGDDRRQSLLRPARQLERRLLGRRQRLRQLRALARQAQPGAPRPVHDMVGNLFRQRAVGQLRPDEDLRHQRLRHAHHRWPHALAAVRGRHLGHQRTRQRVDVRLPHLCCADLAVHSTACWAARMPKLFLASRCRATHP